MAVRSVFKRLKSRCNILSTFIFIFSICPYSLLGQDTENFIKKIKDTRLLITEGGANVTFSIQIEANDKVVENYQNKAIVLHNFQLKEQNNLSFKEQGVLKMTLDVTKEPFYLLKEEKYHLFEKKINDQEIVFEAKTEKIKQLLNILSNDTYVFSPEFDEKGILKKIHTELISQKYHYHSFDIYYIREPNGIRVSSIKGYFFDTNTLRKANVEIIFSIFE